MEAALGRILGQLQRCFLHVRASSCLISVFGKETNHQTVSGRGGRAPSLSEAPAAGQGPSRSCLGVVPAPEPRGAEPGPPAPFPLTVPCLGVPDPFPCFPALPCPPGTSVQPRWPLDHPAVSVCWDTPVSPGPPSAPSPLWICWTASAAAKQTPACTFQRRPQVQQSLFSQCHQFRVTELTLQPQLALCPGTATGPEQGLAGAAPPGSGTREILTLPP